jgi:hypothetical protein
MAGREDEAQQIVTYGIVQRSFEIRHGHLLGFELVAELLMFALQALVAAQMIDGAMLGGRHQPGAGITRYSSFRPLFERGNQRILRQLLGRADIANDPRQTGNQPGRLDSPDGVNGFVNVRFDSVHRYRSQHVPGV